MKTRSITSRNVMGGFLGGMIGILAFSWSSFLMPVGCFIGVLFGYWFQEIIDLIIDFPKRIFRRFHRMPEWFSGVSNEFIKDITKTTSWLSELPAWLFYKAILWFRVLCVNPVVWFFGWLLRAWKFLTDSHPINTAYILQGIAVSIVTAICFIGAVWFWYAADMQHIDNNSFMVLPFMTVVLSSIMVPVLLLCKVVYVDTDDISLKMHHFYKTYDRIARLGKTIFFIRELLVCTGYAVYILLVTFGSMFAIVMLLVAVILFMGCIVILGFFRALYVVAHYEGHWLCFGVTLITTTSMALSIQDFLSGAMLWIVALATGCLSGVCSEIVRRGIGWFYRRFPMALEFVYRTFDEHVESFKSLRVS